MKQNANSSGLIHERIKGRRWIAGVLAGVMALVLGVSEVNAQATGTLTTLVSFDGTSGGYPYSGVIEGSDGNFYGSTLNGGASAYGTIYQLTPSGTLSLLASFSGGADGAYPYGGVIEGNDGYFYGTTTEGGDLSCDAPYGCGTVFRLTRSKILTTLVSFNGSNGDGSWGSLIQGTDDNFYGTTPAGGSGCALSSLGCGTVYQLTSSGLLTTLVSFNDASGAFPQSGVIQGSDGNFYGSTYSGSTNEYGTVYQLTPSGTLTTQVSFNDANGAFPFAGLTLGSDGNFYGTTNSGGTGSNCSGGSSGCGTVYQLTPSGALTTLVSFNGSNGSHPRAGVILGSDGNFYGTTAEGGDLSCDAPYGCGTVFQLTPSGMLSTLISFDGTNGSSPYAGVIQARNGLFYGTTTFQGPNGRGTVYQISVALPLQPPTNLTAAATLRGRVKLAWTASSGAISYNLYEGPGPGQESGTPILTGITRTKATVTNLISGKTYCFTVVASNANSVSASSNEICIMAK